MTEDSPRYEGWRVVGASGVGVFSVSLFVFTFGVLLRPLTEAFSWSREAVSSAFGSMTLAVAFSAPLFGYLVDRHGPRWIVGPSLTVAACAFASLSALTSQLWHLYAVFVVIGLASAGTSPVVYSRVVPVGSSDAVVWHWLWSSAVSAWVAWSILRSAKS